MKIVIIGFSGCGKSTLASKLGDYYKHFVLYMDKISFNENWVKLDRETIDTRLLNVLDNYDSWIIDGNYFSNEFERRCEEANIIYFLDFNRFTCFFSALKRFIKYRNKVRISAPEGCVEKFDYKFIKWLLLDGRKKKRRRHLLQTTQKYQEKSVVFKNRRKLNKYLDKLFKDDIMEENIEHIV